MKSILLIILIIIVGGIGYWKFFGAETGSDEAVAVSCIEVRKGRFVASVNATGRLISRKTEAVKSLYAGIIRDNGFKNGAEVRKGEFLAVITPPEEIRKKKQTDLELAKLDLALVSEQRLQAEELLKAKAASEREVNELKIRQRRQEAQVENLHDELSEKPVLAPFTGLLLEKRFHNGDRIGVGAELFTLVDARAVVIEAKVQQFDLPKIHLGQRAHLRSEIFSLPHLGKIAEISTITARQNTSGYVESYSSFFNVYIQIDSLAPEELRIGAVVEAEIVLQEKPEAIAIPLECVRFENSEREESPKPFAFNPFVPHPASRRRMGDLPANGLNEPQALHRYVFINKNGVAHKREIVTGLANEHLVEILSGLQEGEMVVTAGSVEITAGTKLKVQ
ncbi:MAG: HlyD family efflux transporter periplasmic adaptor subunit [candidate division KSB1 bacterium]|nr:HlyD family efflux transporter periplasmic adaptor subunit [candidate division KSB1 bacterium]